MRHAHIRRPIEEDNGSEHFESPEFNNKISITEKYT